MLDKDNIEEQLKVQQQIEMLEIELKKYLDNEAIARYGNLKAAHPELAMQVMVYIVQSIKAGQINEKIDDLKFKGILNYFQKPKKEFKLLRK